MISEIVTAFDSLSDAEILLWLHELWQHSVNVESWRKFLVEVLQLDEERKIIIHYPHQLGEADDVYHIVCANIKHCEKVLDFFNFECWIKEVRICVDEFAECKSVVDYILHNPAFHDITINLYTSDVVQSPYISDPRIAIKAKSENGC